MLLVLPRQVVKLSDEFWCVNLFLITVEEIWKNKSAMKKPFTKQVPVKQFISQHFATINIYKKFLFTSPSWQLVYSIFIPIIRLLIKTVWKVSAFGVFLGRIFSHSDWIRRDTAGKYGPENFRIRRLFTQWNH